MNANMDAARRIARVELDDANNGVALRIVEALERAGMLRTGLERRAIESCEAFAEQFRSDPMLTPVSRPVRAVGAESLALRAARPVGPRYVVPLEPDGFGWWNVMDRRSIPIAPQSIAQLETKEKAEKVAAALNSHDAATP